MKRPVAPIDWSDRDALRRWFADLSACIEDAQAVTNDLLLPLRERTLGPAEARRLHRESGDAVRSLLDAGERGLVLGSRAKPGEPPAT